MIHDASPDPAPVPLRPLDASPTRRERVAGGAAGVPPRPLTSLIGREDDVAAALALLRDGVRFLTLTGPGGVGKTRLALRIGEEAAAVFPDGVVFVPLAPLADPDLVLPTIARVLGLREMGTHATAGLLAGFLQDTRLLLVLDNAEQVRGAAPAVAALLAACPRVAALVTSRIRLRVAGEQRMPVAPLALPGVPGIDRPDHPDHPTLAAIAASPAVQLFIARAQAVDPAFTLASGNAAAVAAICRRLDGLPLAIELAAARSHVLAPDELLAHLSPSLPMLVDGPEDAPDRLRTMRDAIAWSHNLLTPEEQALFRRLAVFVGGFTLDAVAGVSAALGSSGAHFASRSILDVLSSLVDTSLVQRTGTWGETRFAMLETIREYGLEHLAASGEVEEVARRHAAWCVGVAETVRRSGQLSHGHGLATLEAEQPNMRAALSWLLDRGDATTALHLAAELAEFWLRRNHYWAEGNAWLERALAAAEGAPSAARAEALVGLSMLQWPRDDLSRARQLLAEAEAVARAAGADGALAYARLHQGYVATFSRDFDLAVARAEEALATCEAIPQGFSCNGALWLLARATLERGEDERAGALYERLLASSRVAGDEISIANALVGLAILAEHRGDLEAALSGFVEAATVCLRFGDWTFASHCLNETAITAVALGRPEPAVRLWAAVDAVREAVGAARGANLRYWPPEARPWERAQAVLSPARFVAAWEAGAALSLDEAIAAAVDLARETTLVAPDRLTDRAAGLTVRERDVLRLLVDGLTDKEIAAALRIGSRTVSSHVATIRDKLGAPSRTAAATIAVRDRLV